MNARSESALVALRQILRAIEFNARGLARMSGLTPSQLILLQLLSHTGEASPTDLSKRMSLTMATVTALVDKLEDRGLIVRRRDESDRRRIYVEISKAGVETLAHSPDALQVRFQTRFEALADWEQAWLVASLERVVTLLGAEKIDAAPILDIGALNELPQKIK